MRDTQELTKLMREVQNLKVEMEKKSQALQASAREIITSKRENERLGKLLKEKDQALQMQLQKSRQNSTAQVLRPQQEHSNQFLSISTKVEPHSPVSAGALNGEVSPSQGGIRSSMLHLKNQKIIERLTQEVKDSKLAYESVVQQNTQIE